MWSYDGGLFRWGVDAFQASEGVDEDEDEGIVVGDVLLPASGLPFSVFLGVVLAVELPEGDGFDVGLIPTVELLNAVIIITPCVGCGVRQTVGCFGSYF